MIFQSIVQYAAVLTSTRNINMHKINDTRKVTICDSREKNVRRVVEADNFIRDIMRE